MGEDKLERWSYGFGNGMGNTGSRGRVRFEVQISKRVDKFEYQGSVVRETGELQKMVTSRIW